LTGSGTVDGGGMPILVGMTSTHTSTDTSGPSLPVESGPRPLDRLLPVVAAASLGAAALALVAPDITGGGPVDGMSMTHYMGLLAANQPWNLVLFMAGPVILAETLAITELVLLFSRTPSGWVRALNRYAGLLVGPLMVGIGIYLIRTAVVPLTTGGAWRGPADVVAVLSYLLAAVPLIGITGVELGLLGRQDERRARRLHATFVGVFLVVAHVAMIVGMLDPAVLGWQASHLMPGSATEMPGMVHGS